MPGYNDVGVRPNSGFARGRDGGGYYAQSWQAALASSPNWVVITSFNEWPEGTYIEPSVAYGDAYLGLTAQYAAQFRAGGGASLVAAAPAPAGGAATETGQASAAEAVTEAVAEAPAGDSTAAAADGNAAVAGTEPDAPTVFVQTAVLNLRAGPGTGYALLGAVVEGDALPILGKAAGDGSGGWWQVDSAAGPAWLFGEHVRAAGPLDGVPEVAASTSSTGDSGEAEAAAAAGALAPASPAPSEGLTITIGGRRVTLRPASSNR
jgi:hypothetical protein